MAGAAYYWITGLFGLLVFIIVFVAVGMVATITRAVWDSFTVSWSSSGLPQPTEAMSFFDRVTGWIYSLLQMFVVVVLAGFVIYVLVNSGRREREEYVYT